VAEQSHFQTATAIEQALLLRGERDFVDEAAASACGNLFQEDWDPRGGPPIGAGLPGLQLHGRTDAPARRLANSPGSRRGFGN
jgi:hypothetical protein